ncbi:MAG: BlaI/MecI/CopY family transcriptional regulator [Phycisphaerae bacterium]
MADESAIPTEREMQILKTLWELGPATVRQVYEHLRLDPSAQDLAQNTIQTFLRLMEEKGLVAHVLDGRAFVYQPLYTRQRTVSRFLKRVFDGAADELVSNLLKAKRLTDEELSAIEQMIQEAKKKR